MSETDRTSSTGETWQCPQCGASNPPGSARTSCPGCNPARSRWRPRIARASGLFTWVWAVVVLGVLLMIRWVGDGWWGVTVLLFLPRWLFLTPLPILAAASGVGQRPGQWIVQGAVALVVAGPLMLISMPIQQLWDRPVEGTRVRLMTVNQGMVPLPADRLIQLIERERIDLICFQEGGPEREPALDLYFRSHGWSLDQGKRYLASRYPIVSEMPMLTGERVEDRLYPVTLVRARVRAAPGVEFGVASVHMPTLRFGFYRFLDHDFGGLKRHVAFWDGEVERLIGGLSQMNDVPFLVGGDFNVPPDHAAMVTLGNSLRFAYEEAGWGYGYTRPARYPWFRIDHILASPEWVFTSCRVGPDVGSDHLPLIAEAVLPASSLRP
jgi:vancomycin resistance protein VanJ